MRRLARRGAGDVFFLRGLPPKNGGVWHRAPVRVAIAGLALRLIRALAVGEACWVLVFVNGVWRLASRSLRWL